MKMLFTNKIMEWQWFSIVSYSTIFLEHFEEDNINHYNYKSTIWWRYIDDVFSIDLR